MIDRIKGLFSRSPAMGKVEFVVAGLGNPGKKYEQTRHNAGYMALDHICGEIGVSTDRLKFKSLYGEGIIAGKRAIFLKPTTFMNNSGEAVAEVMRFYKLGLERLIVISDDIALKPGVMRVRRGGSDGGQKGLRSIIELLGSNDFPRVRIGIGAKPRVEMELADWVLTKFTKNDLALLEPVLEKAAEAVELIVSGDIDAAMNRFN